MTDGPSQNQFHSMFDLLRPEETLKLVCYHLTWILDYSPSPTYFGVVLQAVKLESARYGRTRHLVVVSRSRKPTQRELSSRKKNVIGNSSGAMTDNIDNMSNCNDIEESCLLGIDCDEETTVGLVLRILGDTAIRLSGDGWALLLPYHKTVHPINRLFFIPSVDSVLVAADKYTYSTQFPITRWRQRCRLYTRFAPKPERMISTRADRRTDGSLIMTSSTILIGRFWMNGMPWTQSKVEEHHHQTQSEISKCRYS